MDLTWFAIIEESARHTVWEILKAPQAVPGKQAHQIVLFCQHYKWATPWENVSSGVFDQARHKLACTATEAS